MKMGIIGGLMLGGLAAGAVLNLGYGLVLCGIGVVASCLIIIQEQQAAKKEESWRRNYPSYKY